MSDLLPAQIEWKNQGESWLLEIFGDSYFFYVEDKRWFLDAIVNFEWDREWLLDYLIKQEPEFIEYIQRKNSWDLSLEADRIKAKNAFAWHIIPIKKKYEWRLTTLSSLQKTHRKAIRAWLSVIEYYRAIAFEIMDRIDKIKAVWANLPWIYPEKRILDEIRLLNDVLKNIHMIEKDQSQWLSWNSTINNNTVIFNVSKNESLDIMTNLLWRLGIWEKEVKKQYALLEQSQNLAIEEIIEWIL